MEDQEQGQRQGQEQQAGFDQQPGEPGGVGAEVDLSKVRELVLLAYPDVVQEMVSGATLDELLASVQPAKAAFERIVEQAGQRTSPSAPVAPAAPVVPAGQPARVSQFVINVEELSPQAKIAEGLRRRDG